MLGQGTEFEGEPGFPEVGFFVTVLLPGLYPVNEAAAKHGASVLERTESQKEAFARFPRGEKTRYQEGWLP